MIEKTRATTEGELAGEFITRSAQETFDRARDIGEKIRERSAFLLSGELGAGKTLFTKGLAAGLGIDPAEVTSPSFTLVNIHEGRLRLYHIDLYRLEAVNSDDLGLDEILEDEAVTVVEWAERLKSQPRDATLVKIEYLSDQERRVTIRKE